jgi:hypothetical protein
VEFNVNNGQFPNTLFLSGSTLYGTTQSGGFYSGGSGAGIVFAINTDGTGFTNLYVFHPGGGYYIGYTPFGGVVLSGNSLYGTTDSGGYLGGGTVFVLSLGPIPLNFQLNGGSLILNWGNPAFFLQLATNAAGSYSNITGGASPFTNTSPNSQIFYRLKSN